MARERFRFEFRRPKAALLMAAAPALEAVFGADTQQAILEPFVPRLAPRDEAVYLLHATAEVEHALMVQYLYASYSLQSTAPANDWADRIFRIAVEEMGHLACMQNVLLVLGGPINFEREDFPFRSGLYPFPFSLEPLTLGSLAKYIGAERPAIIADPALDMLYHSEIEPLTRADDDEPVNRVGAVFERLLHLFREPTGVPADDPSPPLQDEDFHTDVGPALATRNEWGDSLGAIILGPAPDQIGTPQAARTAVRDVLTRVAQQGEGYPSPSSGLSHFDRFIAIWKEYRQHFPQSPVNDTGPGSPARPVPTDPTTNTSVGRQAIRNERSLRWARLFNLRYRMLLAVLQHYFEFLDPFTYRQKLSGWAFDEMGHVRDIAGKLMNRPLGANALADRAGPPFELPYTLEMPDRERDRWRTHRDIVDASIQLCEELVQDEPTSPLGDKEFLTALLSEDRIRREQLTRLMNGQSPDPDPQQSFFVLLQAKRSQAQSRHAGISTPAGTLKSLFQQEKYDDIMQFLQTGETVLLDPKRRLIAPKKPEESGFFLQIRDGVMQGRFSEKEIEIVRDWIMSLPETPSPGPSLGFATNIRPLFRENDVTSMKFVFDLSKYEDVRDNADAIYSRLSDGTMPCDGPWPSNQVETFKAWIDQGKKP